MNNSEEHLLDEVKLPLYLMQQSLRCLIHTIIFLRSLGTAESLDIKSVSSTIDLGFVSFNDLPKAEETQIEDAINKLIASFAKGTEGQRALYLAFYAHHDTRNQGVLQKFSNYLTDSKSSRIFFEVWIIPVSVLRGTQGDSGTDESRTTLENVVSSIQECAFSKIDHLPSPPKDSCYYAFTVDFSIGGYPEILKRGPINESYPRLLANLWEPFPTRST